MAKSPDSVSLSGLIGGLVADVTGLLRKEIDLAKTEVSEKFSQALNGVEVVMFGLVLAVGAVGVLLSALVAGVAAFLVTQGFTETSADALASAGPESWGGSKTLGSNRSRMKVQWQVTINRIV